MATRCGLCCCVAKQKLKWMSKKPSRWVVVALYIVCGARPKVQVVVGSEEGDSLPRARALLVYLLPVAVNLEQRTGVALAVATSTGETGRIQIPPPSRPTNHPATSQTFDSNKGYCNSRCLSKTRSMKKKGGTSRSSVASCEGSVTAGQYMQVIEHWFSII